MANFSKIKLKCVQSPARETIAENQYIPYIGMLEVSNIPNMVSGYLRLAKPEEYNDSTFIVAGTGMPDINNVINTRFHSNSRGYLFDQDETMGLSAGTDIKKYFASNILPTLLVKNGKYTYDLLGDYVSASQLLHYHISSESPIYMQRVSQTIKMVTDNEGTTTLIYGDSAVNSTSVKYFRSEHFVPKLHYDTNYFELRESESTSGNREKRPYKYLSLVTDRRLFDNDLSRWLANNGTAEYRLRTNTDTSFTTRGTIKYGINDENKISLTTDIENTPEDPASIEIVSSKTIFEPHGDFTSNSYQTARNKIGKIKITTGCLGEGYLNNNTGSEKSFSLGSTIAMYENADPNQHRIDIIAGSMCTNYFPSREDADKARYSNVGRIPGNIIISALSSEFDTNNTIQEDPTEGDLHKSTSFISVSDNVVIKSTQEDGTVFIYKQAGKYFAVSIGDIVRRLANFDMIQLKPYTDDEIMAGFVNKAGNIKGNKAFYSERMIPLEASQLQKNFNPGKLSSLCALSISETGVKPVVTSIDGDSQLSINVGNAISQINKPVQTL